MPKYPSSIYAKLGVHTLSETAEARAQKFVAVTLFLLAPYIVYDAVTTLRHGAR